MTKVTCSLAFRAQAGRDHMAKFDGIVANFDNVEDLLTSLLDREGDGVWVVDRRSNANLCDGRIEPSNSG